MTPCSFRAEKALSLEPRLSSSPGVAPLHFIWIRLSADLRASGTFAERVAGAGLAEQPVAAPLARPPARPAEQRRGNARETWATPGPHRVREVAAPLTVATAGLAAAVPDAQGRDAASPGAPGHPEPTTGVVVPPARAPHAGAVSGRAAIASGGADVVGAARVARAQVPEATRLAGLTAGLARVERGRSGAPCVALRTEGFRRTLAAGLIPPAAVATAARRDRAAVPGDQAAALAAPHAHVRHAATACVASVALAARLTRGAAGLERAAHADGPRRAACRAEPDTEPGRRVEAGTGHARVAHRARRPPVDAAELARVVADAHGSAGRTRVADGDARVR